MKCSKRLCKFCCLALLLRQQSNTHTHTLLVANVTKWLIHVPVIDSHLPIFEEPHQSSCAYGIIYINVIDFSKPWSFSYLIYIYNLPAVGSHSFPWITFQFDFAQTHNDDETFTKIMTTLALDYTSQASFKIFISHGDEWKPMAAWIQKARK